MAPTKMAVTDSRELPPEGEYQECTVELAVMTAMVVHEHFGQAYIHCTAIPNSMKPTIATVEADGRISSVSYYEGEPVDDSDEAPL